MSHDFREIIDSSKKGDGQCNARAYEPTTRAGPAAACAVLPNLVTPPPHPPTLPTPHSPPPLRRRSPVCATLYPRIFPVCFAVTRRPCLAPVSSLLGRRPPDWRRYGTESTPLINPGANEHTHSWTIFVRSPENKVHFLPRSPAPLNHARVSCKHCQRTGSVTVTSGGGQHSVVPPHTPGLRW